MEPVHIPIEDHLDLHHFNPKDVPDLLNEYFYACRSNHILVVKIIHGKGKGILRDKVHSVLKKHPHVKSFSLASAQSGNWGATMVELNSV